MAIFSGENGISPRIMIYFIIEVLRKTNLTAMRCCVSLVNDCTEFSSKVGSMLGA